MTSGQKLGALFWIGVFGWLVMRSGTSSSSPHSAVPSSAPTATSATATAVPAEVTAGQWAKVDLKDLDVDMPATPEVTTTSQGDDDGVVTRRTYEVNRGELRLFQAITLDQPGRVWDAKSADEMAQGLTEHMRAGDSGSALTIVKSERRVVAEMPGRVIQLRIPTKHGTISMRAAFFARVGRFYELLATSAGGESDVDAQRMFGSIRATGAPSPALPPSVGLTPVAAPTPIAGAYETAPSYYTGGAAAPVPEYHGPVHVNGYTRRDGTYVQPYTRSAPNR